MNRNDPFTKLYYIAALLLFACFFLVACGKEPASFTPVYSGEESAIQTAEASTSSSSVPESSTQVAEESTTQAVEESDPALTTDFSNLEYKREKISFREKKSDFEDFSVSRQMQTFSVNGRSYCFDTNIQEADCRERIRFTEELLIKAGITREFRICFYNVVKMKHTYVENGSLYCRMGHMNDIDYLTAVLLAAYGEFVNYGMAYGYAGLLLGEEIPEASYPEDWDYFDLNLLCFSPDFCDEEKLNNSKAIALDFATSYVEKQGHAAYQDLLEKSGQLETAETAREALSEHYKNCGVEPKLSPLLYAMGGTTYSHILRCEYATFYTERDWAEYHTSVFGEMDVDENDLLYEMLHCTDSYKAHRQVFERFRLEMKQYQDFFDLYPYNDNLRVLLVNSDRISLDGYYQSRDHQIQLRRLEVYEHEYIHSMTHSRLRTSLKWVVEGLTTYYSYRFPTYNRACYNYLLRVEIPEMTGVFKDTAQSWLGSQEGRLDLDVIDYYGLYTYWTGKTVYDEPYFAGSAFIDYLVDRFGEGEVLDYFLIHHDLSQLTDKSMEELMAEWKSHLEERFKDYEKPGDQS